MDRNAPLQTSSTKISRLGSPGSEAPFSTSPLAYPGSFGRQPPTVRESLDININVKDYGEVAMIDNHVNEKLCPSD